MDAIYFMNRSIKDKNEQILILFGMQIIHKKFDIRGFEQDLSTMPEKCHCIPCEM